MRPFRFGFTGGQSSKRAKLLESARTVEALGYSTYGLADHFVRPLIRRGLWLEWPRRFKRLKTAAACCNCGLVPPYLVRSASSSPCERA